MYKFDKKKGTFSNDWSDNVAVDYEVLGAGVGDYDAEVKIVVNFKALTKKGTGFRQEMIGTYRWSSSYKPPIKVEDLHVIDQIALEQKNLYETFENVQKEILNTFEGIRLEVSGLFEHEKHKHKEKQLKELEKALELVPSGATVRFIENKEYLLEVKKQDSTFRFMTDFYGICGLKLKRYYYGKHTDLSARDASKLLLATWETNRIGKLSDKQGFIGEEIECQQYSIVELPPMEPWERSVYEALGENTFEILIYPTRDIAYDAIDKEAKGY